MGEAQAAWLAAGHAAVQAHRRAPEGRRPGLALAAQCLQSCRTAAEELARRQPALCLPDDKALLYLQLLVSV